MNPEFSRGSSKTFSIFKKDSILNFSFERRVIKLKPIIYNDI